MLKNFLIIWILSFFVLCLPLLFITEKEKEEEKSRGRGLWINGPINPKGQFVVTYTYLLNLIFLLILPYIIGSDLNFTYFQIQIEYLIIIIVGGILTSGAFYWLLFMPLFPGATVANFFLPI
jgi:hypothetical protein